MAEDQIEKPARPDIVAWVDFADRSAALRRVIVPGNMKGLLLRTATGESGEKVREKALAFGFRELKTRGNLTMIFPDNRIPFSAKILAEALGGKIIPLARKALLEEPWTMNLSDRAPKPAPTLPVAPGPEAELEQPPLIERPAAPQRIQPDPDTIQPIGLNMRSEEVVRDATGRFFRKVSLHDGRPFFVHEGEGEKPALFLRATRREDLEGIASALVVMAGRGTLHQADFDRVIDAAIEPGPQGQIDLPREEVARQLRENMLREISSIALENEAARDRFLYALRIANSAAFVLSRPSDADGLLSPSPALTAFLRRNVRGQLAVDFRGSDDMRMGMPRIFREGSPLQFHDLGGISEDGLSAYVANVLARRPAEGSTVLRLSGVAGSDRIERLRSEIGRGYALEALAEIHAVVADGVQNGEPSILMFIGERRPEMLEALPQAAMRTFRVLTTEDLVNLERDIGRARSKIREYHDGVEADRAEEEDDRAENIRQKPYQPLSRVNEPFTMIPVALEGATTRALERVRRDMEDSGGVDATVAAALGQSLDTLGDILTAEQVDAVAMRMNARDRDRGFLLADQTGVGKGRSLAAMAREHIRSSDRNRVLYFTESAQINAPDVCRDLKGVGAWGEIRVLFLTSGSQMIDVAIDPVTGLEVSRELVSPTAAARKAIFESGAWPEDYNVIITTYSQFRGKDDDASTGWLRAALDESTLLVLDEAHNGLNRNAAQGRNVRIAINQVGPRNVIYGTATPMRDPQGMNLYKPLLPAVAENRLEELLDNMAGGGEVAQEAFTTMLAQDGVLLRRDHDLSGIDFNVDLPDDARMLRYQEVMNRFSPVVEMMIECSSQIGEHMGRRQTHVYNEFIRRGYSQQAARAQTNEMNQYSISLGNPLSNLSRIAMNALKVDQVVDAAIQEIQEGRKPLITFHSTNSGLLEEVSRGANGRNSEEAMRDPGTLTLKDQIRRIHEGMYRLKLNDEVQDARVLYPDVRQTAGMIETLIDGLPDNLPASPIDALVEKLEAHGLAVGEVTGRTLCYRNGEIQRRGNRNKREVMDAFNSGDLDVIIYNSAGATGGSLHASPTFRDQRPRTTIEIEAPTDVIRYVQALGRGNRYGQIHRPKVVSVMTGLVPEMRILQQRNKKLRSLGASVDGNRSHPMLLDDVPDLLNRVGDEATRNVLISMPSLSRRLGFPEFAEDPDNQRQGQGNDAVDNGSGVANSAIDSLANKVMTRSIMLPAREQDDLIQRIRMEFDAIIEELESRNANPLRPKQLDGHIEVRATDIYSGIITEEGDIDTSAFLAPLYISTAIHHFTEEAWDGERLINEVETCRRLYGSDGFLPYAERIRQNLPTLMRPYVPEGVPIDDALADPAAVNARFQFRHARITDLAWLLENMRPGISLRFPSEQDIDGMMPRTIIGLVPPADPAHYDVASAYKIRTISPGMSRPETVAVSRILQCNMDRILFRPGISETFDESYLEEFSRDALMARRLPVQILSGNILQAINEAARNDLGTISLYRDAENHVHRGIVVAKSKVDLEKIPAPVPSGTVFAEMAHRFLAMAEPPHGMLRLLGQVQESRPIGDSVTAELIGSLTQRSFSLDLTPLRKATYEFYAERPGLFEALYDRPMPSYAEAPDRANYQPMARTSIYRHQFDVTTEEGRARAMHVMSLLGDGKMVTSGLWRGLVNEVINDIERITATASRRFTFETPPADPDVIEQADDDAEIEWRN